MLGEIPMAPSAFGTVKKLRADGDVHAQVAAHGLEGLGKLEAGIRVMTTNPESLPY